jgi:hypothetical protein
VSAEIKKEIQLEIADVLFINIVGYSKLSSYEQPIAIDEPKEVVRASEQFQKAETVGRLIKIPTGDAGATSVRSSLFCRPFKGRQG